MEKVEVLERDRVVIVRTIARIESVQPALGLKWQKGMLKYWYERLAELTLITAGAEYDDVDVIELGLKLSRETA